MSASEDLGEEETDRWRQIPSTTVALGATEAWESERKRISTTAATKDSGRGDDHDPNDGGCPMSGRARLGEVQRVR